MFVLYFLVLELQNKLVRNIGHNHTVLVKYKNIPFFDNIRELNYISLSTMIQVIYLPAALYIKAFEKLQSVAYNRVIQYSLLLR